MSSKSRTVRPFRVDPVLNGLFADATLSFGSQHCVAGSAVTVSDSFEHCEVWLRWAPDGRHSDFVQRIREGVPGSNLRLDDCSVIVVARNGYFKMRELVYRHSLADPSGLGTDVRLDLVEGGGQRRSVFRGGSHSVQVDAYVVLARTFSQADRCPLRPWRAGSWLARGSFAVRSRNDAELFRPQRLDRSQRGRLGLLDGTVTFPEFEGEVADPEVRGSEAVVFWVDEELLLAIDAQRRSSASEAIQRWLFAEFVAAVIHRYARDAAVSADAVGHTYDDCKGSLIGRIAALIAGRGASSAERDDLLKVMRDSPESAIARSQDRVSLLGSARKAVKEDAS